MNLFNLANFTLSSGKKSNWKIDCDALSESDIECLAHLIKQLVGNFASVEGVPTGGNRLAEALKPFCSKGPHLIVDDVLTTGRSMTKALNAHKEDKWIIGAVIFARGPVLTWVKALFSIDESLWPEVDRGNNG
jgi:orotate phosphoribosyltransferase